MSNIYNSWFIITNAPSRNYHSQPKLSKNLKAEERKIKTLLFITTHMPDEHVSFLHRCWPLALRLSPTLLRQSDVLFFSTGQFRYSLLEELWPTASRLSGQTVRYETFPNPGYQQGAMLAMEKAIEHKWFDGYDWVIRLNPDVLIRNETWLVKTMLDDDVDGIFAECPPFKYLWKKMHYKELCEQKCTQARAQTDFFAIRPRILPRKIPVVIRHGESNSEDGFTKAMSNVTKSGRDRWLPNQTQEGHCRITGRDSPVIHDHDFIKDDSCGNLGELVFKMSPINIAEHGIS